MFPFKNYYHFFIFLFYFGIAFSQDTHSKEFVYEYDSHGALIAEGWLCRGEKVDYWYFYHSNGVVSKKGHFNKGEKKGYWYFYNPSGKLEKEGHFENGKAENWWIFYNQNNQAKFQYKNNKKNGFALLYEKNKLMKAEKYEDDQKVGEWTSLSAFKMDNPNAPLK